MALLRSSLGDIKSYGLSRKSSDVTETLGDEQLYGVRLQKECRTSIFRHYTRRRNRLEWFGEMKKYLFLHTKSWLAAIAIQACTSMLITSSRAQWSLFSLWAWRDLQYTVNFGRNTTSIQYPSRSLLLSSLPRHYQNKTTSAAFNA